MAQNNDFAKMTINQLKEVLRGLQKTGLKVTLAGNKNELIAKIHQAYGQGPVAQGAQNPAVPAVPVITVPPLNVENPPAKAAKTVKEPKDPKATLVSALRDANQSFGAAFELLLQAYGLGPVPAAENLVDVVVKAWATTPVALVAPETYDQLMQLRLVDLKKILKDRKQKVGGKKEELVNRILNPEVEAPAGGIALPPLDPINVPLENMAQEADPNDLLTQLPAVPAFPEATTALPTIPGLPGFFPEVPTGIPAAFPDVPAAFPTAFPDVPAAFPTAFPEVPNVAGAAFQGIPSPK